MIENLLELNKYKIKIKICILKKWCYNSIRFRGVAQSGRVLGLGPRCRRFESFRPDQIFFKSSEPSVNAGFFDVFCI